MAEEEEVIVLPDGTTLPPGYTPGDINDPAPDPTEPPNGESWTDWYNNTLPPE
jgi:hypothetical protein